MALFGTYLCYLGSIDLLKSSGSKLVQIHDQQVRTPSTRMSLLPLIPQADLQSPYGDLGLLPPEIRANIYALVFAEGSTALARSSKALHADTWDALHRYGIFRAHIQSASEDWGGCHMHRKHFKNVQNVHIRITPSSPYSPPPWWELRPHSRFLTRSVRIMHAFVNAIEKPKTCRIQINRLNSLVRVTLTLEAFTWLRNFERVDVELSPGPSPWNRYEFDDKAIDIIRDVLCPKDKSERSPEVTVVQMDREIDVGSLTWM